MIKRLRAKYTDKELSEIYSKQYTGSDLADHVIRIEKSIEFINDSLDNVNSVADLSCGDGKILNGVLVSQKYYGDFTSGYEFHGPIETTINNLPPVDLFICSETLEHLDDPVAVLKQIRNKTKYLFISTPVGKFDDDNLQHYWAWDFKGIKKNLTDSGFKIIKSEVLELSQSYYYDFQLVYCK